MSTENQAPAFTFSFGNLTLDHVNLILAGLAELPFKLAADLIVGIRSAAQSQIDANVPPKAEEVQPEVEPDFQ